MEANEKLKAFGEDIDALCMKHGIDYEGFINMQADLARVDASKQTDEDIKACLEGMVEALEHAAFNFYASFK